MSKIPLIIISQDKENQPYDPNVESSPKGKLCKSIPSRNILLTISAVTKATREKIFKAAKKNDLGKMKLALTQGDLEVKTLSRLIVVPKQLCHD